MKRLLLLSILFFTIHRANAQSIPGYNADQLMQHLTSKDTIYIVNFWATWCPPCVAELPQFNILQQRYDTKPVKIIMVSMDFKESYPDKLDFFVQKRAHLVPEVVWFTETDANVFIPKIDDSWQGSIPATMIVHGKTKFKKFIEGTITTNMIAGIVDTEIQK